MNRFEYTHGDGVLTEEQRQFYEDNGYIVIKNNVSDDLINKLRQRFIDICNGKVETGFMTVMVDPSLKRTDLKGEFLINKVQDILSDEVLFKYAADSAITEIISSIIGPNFTAVHSMLINKPPGADPRISCHLIHQDLHYFPFRPINRIVASWTAMERIDETNGCLFVVPGTHKGKLYEHTYPEGLKNWLYHSIQGVDHFPKVNVIMDKGDSVFFHPLLLHGSGPNCSTRFRKAISCHFVDSHCHFIDVKGTLHEKITREIEDLTARKGLPLKYVDYWKMKSRLVQGIPGTFQAVTSNF